MRLPLRVRVPLRGLGDALPAWLLAAALVFALGGPGRFVHEAVAHDAAAIAAAGCTDDHGDEPVPADEDDGHPSCVLCVTLASTRCDVPGPAWVLLAAERPAARPRTVAAWPCSQRRSAAAPRGPPARARSAHA